MVQVSAGTGDWRLAKSASKLLVAHMELMAAAAQNPGTPVGMDAPVRTNEWPDPEGNTLSDALPFWTAIHALQWEKKPGSCWARVLELEAERATADNRQQMYYPKVVEALTAYYERTQHVEKLQWIAGLHQSRHEVLG